MESFNQHVSAHPFAARFVVMVVIWLTLLTAMASAKLRTETFVVCLLSFILHFIYVFILEIFFSFYLIDKGFISINIFSAGRVFFIADNMTIYTIHTPIL